MKLMPKLLCLLLSSQISLAASRIIEFNIEETFTESAAKEKQKSDQPKNLKQSYLSSYYLDKQLIIITTDKSTRVVDLKQNYLYNSENAGKSYTKSSLYAKVDFRQMERQNRKHIAAVFEAANLEKKNKLPLSSATLMDHLFSTNLGKAPTRTETEDKITFAHEGKILCSFSKKGAPWTPELSEQFSRSLRISLGIHPAILAELKNSKNCPFQMEINLYNMGKTQFIFKLKMIKQNKNTKPINFDIEKLSLTSLVNSELAAPALKKLSELKKIGFEKVTANYKARADQLIKDKKPFEAFLTMMANSLATGNRPTADEQKRLRELAKDKDVLAVIQAISPRSEEQAKLAVTTLTKLLAKATEGKAVLYIFRANINDSLDNKNQAIADFWAALETDPMIVGAWHDLGKIYRTSYKSDIAWQCWDVARSINSKHPFFKDISKMELQLKKDFPEYFTKQ